MSYVDVFFGYGRDYTYHCKFPVQIGDEVLVAVRGSEPGVKTGEVVDVRDHSNSDYNGPFSEVIEVL